MRDIIVLLFFLSVYHAAGEMSKASHWLFPLQQKTFPYEGKPWMCESPKPPLSGEVARRSRDGEVAANL